MTHTEDGYRVGGGKAVEKMTKAELVADNQAMSRLLVRAGKALDVRDRDAAFYAGQVTQGRISLREILAATRVMAAGQEQQVTCECGGTVDRMTSAGKMLRALVAQVGDALGLMPQPGRVVPPGNLHQDELDKWLRKLDKGDE